MAFVWDERRIEILRTLWPGGVSAREIADKIGAPSKNSIISKARRIGLPPHVNAKGHLTLDQRRRRNRVIKIKMGSKFPKTREKVKAAGGSAAWIKKHLEAAPKEPLPIDPPKPRTDLPPLIARVTFDELEMSHCKFPVGDPREADFGFCGQHRVLGKPYCSDCCQRAYTIRETRVSRQSQAISSQHQTVSSKSQTDLAPINRGIYHKTERKSDGAAEAALRDAVEGDQRDTHSKLT